MEETMVTTEPRERAGQVSWSVSRAKLFGECRRAYYYKYFLASGGWRADAPELSRKAYALSKMSSLPLLVGETVHAVIADAVRSEDEDLSEEAMVGRGRELFRRIVAASRAGRVPPLSEFYYGPAPSEARLAECSDLVASCLRSLWQLPLWRDVRALQPDDRLVLEEFATFHVGNAAAIVRPDLVFRKGGRIHLVDWKSGKPRASDRLQLACYALFAQYRWHVRPEEIVVSAAYLRDGVVSPSFLSPAELSLARGVVESGYKQLAKAVPRGPLSQHPPDFPCTTDPWPCKWCNYGELCARGIDHSSACTPSSRRLRPHHCSSATLTIGAQSGPT